MYISKSGYYSEPPCSTFNTEVNTQEIYFTKLSFSWSVCSRVKSVLHWDNWFVYLLAITLTVLLKIQQS